MDCHCRVVQKGGGAKPFFTFQAIACGVLFVLLYWQSLRLEKNPASGHYESSPTLLLLGVPQTTPHSLRNSALAFAMLCSVNVLGLVMSRTSAVGPIAVTLNIVGMLHYAAEALIFKTISVPAVVALEFFALLSVFGFGLKCGPQTAAERAAPPAPPAAAAAAHLD